MFDWIAKKSENYRVYMCIKEVKWDIEGSTNTRRAVLLALVQYIRNSMFEPMGVPKEIFDNPLGYTRSDLMGFYNILEDVRNQNRRELDATKKNMKNFGMELPSFSIEHANNTTRSLEVWMCTLGSGISPDKRDDVREIWKMLLDAKEAIPEAIKILRDVEKQTSEMTGQDVNIFHNMGEEAWVQSCNYIPEYFSKRFT
jgi:hypothetical protein